MTTVHFFTKGDFSVPSSRYRSFMLAERINESHTFFRAKCYSPKGSAGPVAFKSPGGFLQEVEELHHVHKQTKTIAAGDIIYCQRPVYKRLRGLYLMSRRTSHPLVFDYDDAVFLNRPNMTRWFLERADVVIAGNQFLESYAEWYSDKVYRVPTAIPYKTYSRVEYSATQEEPFWIGWVGNAVAHRDNLFEFADRLEIVANSHDGLGVHLVGVRDADDVKERFAQITNIEIEFTDWIPAEEYKWKIPDVISSFDVGVMPLEDTFWNRGKSAFKLLEYMACGVPVIASPVGENAHIIEDSVNGYLARNRGEWEQAIQALQSPAHREEISTEARRTIEQSYTQEVVTEQLLSILKRECVNV